MKLEYNLILIIACYFITNTIFLPSMPSIAQTFAASSESVKVTMTVFQVGAVIACILSGFFADFIGKKNFLLIGIAFAIVGSFTCLFAINLELLIIGRFLQGIGAAVGFMMGFALAVDLFDSAGALKIIALNGVVVSIISIFMPYFGGAITQYLHWQLTFIVTIISWIFVFIVSYKIIPKIANLRSELHILKSAKNYLKIIINRTFFCYAILNSIFFAGFLFSLSYLPFFYANVLHLSANSIGILIGISVFMSFGIFSVFSVKLYQKFGVDGSIKIGLGLSIFSGAFILLTMYLGYHSLLIMFVATCLYFSGFGTIYSGSISKSLSVFKDQTVTASALRTILISIFSVIGSYLAQSAKDESIFSFGLILITTAILSSIIFSLRVKNK